MYNNKKIKKKKILFIILTIIFLITIIVLDGIKTFKEIDTCPQIKEIALKNGDIKENVLYADLIDNPEAYDKTVEKATLQISSNYTDIFDFINNEYFNININLNDKTVVMDGKQSTFKELFQISEEEAGRLLNSIDLFKENVEKNLIGDIEYGEEEINIVNPYSTNNIGIITSESLEDIDCGGNVSLVTKVADNTYYIEYSDAVSTKNGYEKLKDNELLDSVNKDQVGYIEENFEEIQEEIVSEASFTADGELGNAEPELGLFKAKLSVDSSNLKKEIKVAIVDSGVETNHTALNGRVDMNGAYDFLDTDSTPNDENGHGTHVAGIVVKNTPSNVKIIPIKVMNEEGKGAASVITKGISRAINVANADIINLSIGSDKDIIIQEEENVLKDGYDKGKVIIAASGNGNEKGMDFVSYPASSKYTIGIGNVQKKSDGTYEIFPSSQRGPEVDYTGIGTNIYSTIPNNEFGRKTGTSMATPYISAACALAKVKNPSYSRNQIYSYLNKYTIDLGDSGKDNTYGNGLVDFSSMFEKPEIIKCEVLKDEGENDTSSVILTFIAKNQIMYSRITSTSDIPTSWNEKTGQQYKKIRYTNLKAGETYYLWAKDSVENVINQKVTISPIQVTSVSIDKSSLTMEENETATLNAIITPTYATNLNVNWSSLDEDIAVVDNLGNIKAQKEGKTEIIVTTEDGNKTARCNINVNPVSVKSVEIDKVSINLKEKQEEKLNAIIKPDNAKNKNVEWQSDDTEIAIVDGNGLVKALKMGETEISAITEDGNKIAKCKVIVDGLAETIPPVINVNYKEANNGESVIVTLTANEKIKPLDGWNISEDKLVLTREYTESTDEIIEVQDISDNVTKVRIYVIINTPEKDTTPPQVTIRYSDSKIGEPVIVTVTSNEPLKEIEGWSLSDDKMVLTKQYSQDTIENIKIEDLEGNATIIRISAKIKENEDNTVDYKVNYYDNRKFVIVEIVTNKEVKPLIDWKLSNDKKTMTRSYYVNTIDEIEIEDIDGNIIKIPIKVIMDKKSLPKLSIDGLKTNVQNPTNSIVPEQPNIPDDENIIVTEPDNSINENIVSNSIGLNETTNNISNQINNSIVEEITDNLGYKIENDLLLDVKCKTSVEEFKRKLNASSKIMIKSNNKEVRSGYIGTGMTVEIDNNTYNIVVIGDVNGDGIGDSEDSLLIKSYRNEIIKLEGCYLKAADINKDKEVNIKDSKLLLYHRADVRGFSLNYK